MTLNDYSDGLHKDDKALVPGNRKELLINDPNAMRKIRDNYERYHNMITLDDKNMIADFKPSQEDLKTAQETMLTSMQHREEPYIAGGVNDWIKNAKPGDFISYSPPDYSWQKDALKQPLDFTYRPIHIPKEIANDMLIHNISFTFLEKLDMAWLVIKKAPALIKGIYIIYSSFERFKMSNDLKTTIMSVIQGILVILGVFGVSISPENTEIILQFVGTLFAVLTMIKGWFTNKPDKPKEV